MSKRNWKKIIKKRSLIGIGGLGLIFSLILNLFLFQKLQQVEEVNVVERVIDGDTFVLKWGQRIRLQGVDAPPLDLCGGKEAKEKLEELVLEKRVKLEEPVTDDYGRILAFVYQGDIFVDEAMLKAGWGRFDRAKNSKTETLRAAFQLAQEQERGIFSPLCRQEENPDNPECVIKGNISRPSGEKWYHFPGCREYNITIVEKDLGEEWFCNEKEAQKAGYKKAANCYGKSFNEKRTQ